MASLGIERDVVLIGTRRQRYLRSRGQSLHGTLKKYRTGRFTHVMADHVVFCVQ